MSGSKSPTFFMAVEHTNSCQYIFNDVQQADLPMIHGADVSCEFPGNPSIQAVKHVDFGIQKGEITAIIGESGSGKTSLLKLIYGLLEPSTGEVRFHGWLVPTRKDKLIPGHDAMKLVSQGFDDLNLYAKVWDNVASQLSNTNIELKVSRTQEILEKLKIDHLASKRIADLSGGEKQRVAISRALINDPEVLLMDEPFNQVDAAFRDELQQDMQRIVSETGLTIVMVSHDPAEVLAMADFLIVMKNGKITDQGKAHQLYNQPNHPYTARLLAKSNILSPEQAKAAGIQEVLRQEIAIKQEHIAIQEDPASEFWVKEVRFRGFYNELLVGNTSLTLHMIQFPIEKISKGTKIKISIKQYHSFKQQTQVAK